MASTGGKSSPRSRNRIVENEGRNSERVVGNPETPPLEPPADLCLGIGLARGWWMKVLQNKVLQKRGRKIEPFRQLLMRMADPRGSR
jgi:hypothetical protein